MKNIKFIEDIQMLVPGTQKSPIWVPYLDKVLGLATPIISQDLNKFLHNYFVTHSLRALTCPTTSPYPRG